MQQRGIGGTLSDSCRAQSIGRHESNAWYRLTGLSRGLAWKAGLLARVFHEIFSVQWVNLWNFRYSNWNWSIIIKLQFITYGFYKKAEQISPLGHSLRHPLAALSRACSRFTTAAPLNALPMNPSGAWNIRFRPGKPTHLFNLRCEDTPWKKSP